MPDPTTVDYPGAIWVPAHPNNYGGYAVGNTPRALVLHTPEEAADNDEVTPRWFQNPAAGGSTHYYADNDGDMYQMVRDYDCPWANGNSAGVNRTWKGARDQWPPWAQVGVSLNCQTLSVEIEGRAATIGETLTDRQFMAVVAWIRFKCDQYGIPRDRDHIIGHFEVSTDRTDPGRDFPWARLMAAVNAEAPRREPQVGDKPIAFSPEQHAALEASVFRRAVIVPDKFIRTGVPFKTADGSELPAGSLAAGYRVYVEHAERPQ
jgi:N-acetyl-anhydromuramyl-L-alanine amidase AmpD